MLDNSILSVGTIKILNDFNIKTVDDLKNATLPKVGDKSHIYAYNSFKKRNLDEINEYLDLLKFEPYFGKQIKVTFEKFSGESIYNVIGFDDDKNIILKTVCGTMSRSKKPFTVDKLWFNQELTGRKIEIIDSLMEGYRYSGIGDSGMTKDILVEGVLSIENNLFILKNSKHRVYSVNPKTLKLIK